MMEIQHYRHVSENGVYHIITQQEVLMCLDKMPPIKGLLHERSLPMKKENNTRNERN